MGGAGGTEARGLSVFVGGGVWEGGDAGETSIVVETSRCVVGECMG
jgi:hypothetical protein